MTLHQILFGEFTPPPVAKIHRVRINGFDRCKPFVAPPTKPDTRGEASEEMYQAIKDNPGITCQQLAEKMKRNISYIYTLRTILLDSNRIESVREKRQSGGGLSFSALYVKERGYASR